MRFGVNVSSIMSSDLSGPEEFDYALRMVRAARDNGFDGIFAAHHYATGSSRQMFQPIPWLARMAAEAPGMTFGTTVYLLSLHSPVEAAEQAANLDIMTGGKFIFGVGQGYRDAEYQSFGIPKATRTRRLVEGVQVVRRLWAEEEVTWEGEFFTLRGVTINPKPVQRPGPPIWVGADTPSGVARAAEVGDAWLTSPRQSKEFIRSSLAVYRRRRQELDLPANPVPIFREMHVQPRREDAEAEIMGALERLYQ
ncbi:MAG: LLM class flavin-dependent oxidoreductase, partial [Dehalococcoidia bacterium]